MIFVFPQDYFDKRAPEEYYRLEFDLAHDLGCDVVLVDFDKIRSGTDPFSTNVEYDDCIAVWRGWQMTSADYSKFYEHASAHGLILLNSPSEYVTCHELSNSYPLISQYSVDTVFITPIEASPLNIRTIMDDMGTTRLFVKDTVKGQRDLPCIINEGDSDDAIEAKITALIDDRGESFTGILAFRRFVELSGETRFFVLDGQIAAYSEHFSDSAAVSPSEAAKPIEILSGVSRFFTLDMALDLDGNALVVETGDGQVSECAEHSAADLVGMLAKIQ